MSQTSNSSYPYEPNSKNTLFLAISTLGTAFRALFLAVAIAWKFDILCDKLSKMFPNKSDELTFHTFKVYDSSVGKTYTVTGWLYQDKSKIANVVVFESSRIPFDNYNNNKVLQELIGLKNGDLLISKEYEQATRSLRNRFWSGK